MYPYIYMYLCITLSLSLCVCIYIYLFPCLKSQSQSLSLSVSFSLFYLGRSRQHSNRPRHRTNTQVLPTNGDKGKRYLVNTICKQVRVRIRGPGVLGSFPVRSNRWFRFQNFSREDLSRPEGREGEGGEERYKVGVGSFVCVYPSVVPPNMDLPSAT